MENSAGNGAATQALAVLAPGVVKSALAALLPCWPPLLANAASIQYAGTGLLLRQLERGERADAVILPEQALDTLIGVGAILPETRTVIGATHMGVAIGRHAAPLDLSTPQALKQALLQARAIAAIQPANSTSGQHFAWILRSLGIEQETAPRLKLIERGYVAQLVADGEADIGIQQISEILPVPGARLAGPLPAMLQQCTRYAAGVHTTSRDPELARAWVRELAGTPSRKVLQQHGLG